MYGETTSGYMKGRALTIAFLFPSTVFNQQGSNCANLKACSLPNPQIPHRFYGEGFVTGNTVLRLLRDGRKAPHHLAPSLVQYQK